MTNTAAALLQVIDAAGEAVLTLTESLTEAEFRRSRLTRHEVHRQLCTLADTLAALPPALLQGMPEIDAHAWRAARQAFALADETPRDDALWFAVQSQVPATLSWLRLYRQSHPQWFTY